MDGCKLQEIVLDSTLLNTEGEVCVKILLQELDELMKFAYQEGMGDQIVNEEMGSNTLDWKSSESLTRVLMKGDCVKVEV